MLCAKKYWNRFKFGKAMQHSISDIFETRCIFEINAGLLSTAENSVPVDLLGWGMVPRWIWTVAGRAAPPSSPRSQNFGWNDATSMLNVVGVLCAGNYWAIHPACVESFSRGDYRRRHARRRAVAHKTEITTPARLAVTAASESDAKGNEDHQLHPESDGDGADYTTVGQVVIIVVLHSSVFSRNLSLDLSIEYSWRSMSMR